MPANKNAMTRYKILDELLSCRYHDYSLDDLTEEVNRRVLPNYIQIRMGLGVELSRKIFTI